MRWLTLLALQALGLVALLAKTGLLRFASLLTFNGLMSSQTLLASTRSIWTLTCFTLIVALRWYKRDPLIYRQNRLILRYQGD